MPHFEAFFYVPGVGLEPTRDCSHRFLKPTRKPVPPPRQMHYFTTSFLNWQSLFEHLICFLFVSTKSESHSGHFSGFPLAS